MHLTHIPLYKKISLSMINNINLPLCINCIYFIKDHSNYLHESLEHDKKYGKCKLFGEKNLITGEIDYFYTSYCRADSKLCGINGTKYIEK